MLLLHNWRWRCSYCKIEDDGWYVIYYIDTYGHFPGNFLKEITEEKYIREINEVSQVKEQGTQTE